MEPRIQYAKTKDGVRIAYATVGQGAPVVWAQQPLCSHVQLEWQEPLRVPFDAVATKRMLVRYDTRGVGLSDRQADDFSHDAHVLDRRGQGLPVRRPS